MLGESAAPVEFAASAESAVPEGTEEFAEAAGTVAAATAAAKTEAAATVAAGTEAARLDGSTLSPL